MSNGSNRPNKDMRLQCVQRLILLGLPMVQIQAEVSLDYSVSKRQVRKDIASVRKAWKDDSEEEKPYKRFVIDKLYMETWRAAMKGKAYGPAVMALRALVKLHDLEASVDLNINIEDSKVSKMRSADKGRRFQELLRKIEKENSKSGQKTN